MGAANLLKEPPIKQTDEIILEAFRDIGQILAEARIEQNLSITQVASKIHIRQRYLIDLEEGHLSDLPGRVYILGFIRTYARLLNLDGEELVRRVSLIPNLPDYERGKVSMPVHQEEEPSYVVLIVSTVLILSVSIGGYLFLKPSSKATHPLGGVTAMDSSQSQAPEEPVGQESAREEIMLEGQSVDLPKELSIDSSAQLLPKIIYPKDMPTVVPSIPLAPKEEKPQGLASLTKKVTIKAIEPSWVEVRDESKRVIFMKVLKAKEEYVVPEKPGTTISTGNAGGIDIFVGDKKLPTLGARGEVKRDLHVEAIQ
jgi:cytoskeleton protein RodZ